MALKAKEAGNNFYKRGELERALAEYRRGIAACGDGDAELRGALEGNASAAAFELGRYDLAIAHCDAALAAVAPATPSAERIAARRAKCAAALAEAQTAAAAAAPSLATTKAADFPAPSAARAAVSGPTSEYYAIGTEAARGIFDNKDLPGLSLLGPALATMSVPGDELRMLFAAVGDPRHVLRSLEQLAGVWAQTPRPRELRAAVHINDIVPEMVARDLLLVAMLFGAGTDHCATESPAELPEEVLDADCLAFDALFASHGLTDTERERVSKAITWLLAALEGGGGVFSLAKDPSSERVVAVLRHWLQDFPCKTRKEIFALGMHSGFPEPFVATLKHKAVWKRQQQYFTLTGIAPPRADVLRTLKSTKDIAGFAKKATPHGNPSFRMLFNPDEGKSDCVLAPLCELSKASEASRDAIDIQEFLLHSVLRPWAKALRWFCETKKLTISASCVPLLDIGRIPDLGLFDYISLSNAPEYCGLIGSLRAMLPLISRSNVNARVSTSIAYGCAQYANPEHYCARQLGVPKGKGRFYLPFCTGFVLDETQSSPFAINGTAHFILLHHQIIFSPEIPADQVAFRMRTATEDLQKSVEEAVALFPSLHPDEATKAHAAVCVDPYHAALEDSRFQAQSWVSSLLALQLSGGVKKDKVKELFAAIPRQAAPQRLTGNAISAFFQSFLAFVGLPPEQTDKNDFLYENVATTPAIWLTALKTAVFLGAIAAHQAGAIVEQILAPDSTASAASPSTRKAISMSDYSRMLMSFQDPFHIPGQEDFSDFARVPLGLFRQELRLLLAAERRAAAFAGWSSPQVNALVSEDARLPTATFELKLESPVVADRESACLSLLIAPKSIGSFGSRAQLLAACSAASASAPKAQVISAVLFSSDPSAHKMRFVLPADYADEALHEEALVFLIHASKYLLLAAQPLSTCVKL